MALVPIPGGHYTPFFPRKEASGAPKPQSVMVAPFEIERTPVTKALFAKFLEKHPQWRKGRVKKLFSDSSYLENWKQIKANAPVTDISWFAARAYCEALGEELPTTDEWEYVVQNRKAFGVDGIVDEFFEWTSDFNGESTDDDERSSFCGKGSQGGLNQSDAPRYMRYAFRSSLQANYAVKNLGFRCAKGEKR